MLNTLAAFAVTASMGIGTIFGSLIALCAFERRMLGRPARLAAEAHRATRAARPAPAVPAQSRGSAPAQGTVKSAKSKPGETTQLTSDSAVGEAAARCQVPAGTST